MTLREYLAQLGDLVKKNPKALDLVVLTAGDDEGKLLYSRALLPYIGEV